MQHCISPWFSGHLGNCEAVAYGIPKEKQAILAARVRFATLRVQEPADAWLRLDPIKRREVKLTAYTGQRRRSTETSAGCSVLVFTLMGRSKSKSKTATPSSA